MIRRRLGAPNDQVTYGGGGGGRRAPCGWYTHSLARHPVKTKAITLGILNFIGDLCTQLFVEKKTVVDHRRLAAMTSMGLLAVGPLLHYWFGFLNKAVRAPRAKGAVIRLVVDQLIFAPLYVAFTFSYLLLVEGNASQIQQKLQSDWKPTLIANWKLWIPFQFCNFMFVPPSLQVLFSNIVGFVWNAYISYASHRPASVTASLVA